MVKYTVSFDEVKGTEHLKLEWNRSLQNHVDIYFSMWLTTIKYKVINCRHEQCHIFAWDSLGGFCWAEEISDASTDGVWVSPTKFDRVASFLATGGPCSFSFLFYVRGLRNSHWSPLFWWMHLSWLSICLLLSKIHHFPTILILSILYSICFFFTIFLP